MHRSLRISDRLLAWLVTGPLARLTAFLIELTIAVAASLRRRARDRFF